MVSRDLLYLSFGGDDGTQLDLHLVRIPKLGQVVIAHLQALQEFTDCQACKNLIITSMKKKKIPKNNFC